MNTQTSRMAVQLLGICAFVLFVAGCVATPPAQETKKIAAGAATMTCDSGTSPPLAALPLDPLSQPGLAIVAWSDNTNPREVVRIRKDPLDFDMKCTGAIVVVDGDKACRPPNATLLLNPGDQFNVASNDGGRTFVLSSTKADGTTPIIKPVTLGPVQVPASKPVGTGWLNGSANGIAYYVYLEQTIDSNNQPKPDKYYTIEYFYDHSCERHKPNADPNITRAPYLSTKGSGQAGVGGGGEPGQHRE